MRLPAFRRAPAEYDELFVDTMASAYLERTPWTELRLEAVRSLVDPQPGERVLDLGCAAGAISHFLTCLGCETIRSEEHTSELQSRENLVCRLLLEKKKNK